MKKKTKTIKAWALFDKSKRLGNEQHWGFYYVFPSAADALQHVDENYYVARPCKIIYEL